MQARIRDERQQARAEWRRRWRSLPNAQRRRGSEAVRRGAAVDDPALAAVAAEAAEHRLRGDEGSGLARHRSAIDAAQGLFAAALLAAGIIDGDALRILFGACLAVLAAASLVMQRVERRRLERAAAANRALAGQPRYPPGTT
jgi:hypothetical protein